MKIETIEYIKALNSYLETLDEEQLNRFTNIIKLERRKKNEKRKNFKWLLKM